MGKHLENYKNVQCTLCDVSKCIFCKEECFFFLHSFVYLACKRVPRFFKVDWTYHSQFLCVSRTHKKMRVFPVRSEKRCLVWATLQSGLLRLLFKVYLCLHDCLNWVQNGFSEECCMVWGTDTRTWHLFDAVHWMSENGSPLKKFTQSAKKHLQLKNEMQGVSKC